MKKCSYCGRYYSSYETCPGCGSVRFEEVRNHGAIRIDKVPSDGYHIDINSMKQTDVIGKILKFLGIGIVGYCIVMFFIIYFIVFVLSIEANGIQLETGTTFIDLITFFVGISFIIPSPLWGILFYWGGSAIIKNNKRTVEKLNRLKTNGVLIKNLRYSIQNYQIKILYETHSGVKIPFTSYVMSKIPSPRPETCDILFDRDDPGIYYIGFDIY